MLPLLNGAKFVICRGVHILDLRTGLQASKVSPLPSDSHGILEAHREDGQIGAIELQPRNVSWELFNGGRRRRHGSSEGRRGDRGRRGWSS